MNLNNFFNQKKTNKFSGNNNTNTNSILNNSNLNINNNNRINGLIGSVFASENNESDSHPRFISNILQKNKNQSHNSNNIQQQLHNTTNNASSSSNNNGKNIMNNHSNTMPLNINAASNVSSSQIKISNIYNSFQQQNDAISSIDQLKISQNSNKTMNNSNGNGTKPLKYDSLISNENIGNNYSNFGTNSKNGTKNDSNNPAENSRNFAGNGIGSNYGFDQISARNSNSSSSLLDTTNSGNYYDTPSNLSKQSRLNSQTNVQSALSGRF
jgi:hypothetical protein